MTIYDLDKNISIETLCEKLKLQIIIKVRSCVKCKETNCACLTYVFITSIEKSFIEGLIMVESPINKTHLVFTNMDCYINNNPENKDKIYITETCKSRINKNQCVSFIEVIPVIVDTIVPVKIDTKLKE